MKFILKIYIISFIILAINSLLVDGIINITISGISKYIYPLLGCIIIYVLHKYVKKYILSYFLFFITSIAMIFNLSNPMTGNYVSSKNIYLFGLSFYSLTLAYKSYKEEINFKDIIIASNPLILFTGPIAIYFKEIKETSFHRRCKYYIPYLIIGIFFSQVIASPLTNFFTLIEKTNTPLVLIYGIIFEVFIYFNFAGLSLIIYAVFGIVGISIPLNFRQPFSSRNLIEFWRNWHISLSTVLKELFYSPIRKRFNGTIAILVVFICSGFWHGVSLNFIIWAGFHALCYIITKLFLKKGYGYITTLIMIFAIPLGRIIFADSNAHRLMLKLSFNDNSFDYSFYKSFGSHSFLSLFLGFTIIFLEFTFAKSASFKQHNYKFLRKPAIQFWIFILILFLISNNNGLNFAAYGQR